MYKNINSIFIFRFRLIDFFLFDIMPKKPAKNWVCNIVSHEYILALKYFVFLF